MYNSKLGAKCLTEVDIYINTKTCVHEVVAIVTQNLALDNHYFSRYIASIHSKPIIPS